ncbi:MAG TPA: hypothetical protein VNB29_05525 [Chthoniobacterales bacterium]|nr:hypothetical protein [Chthoniobacterales bacterium]
MAAVVWDETANGNFSNDRTAPTPIAVGDGSNTIRGLLTGGSGDVKYHDYVTFGIPAGYAMVAIKLDALTSSNSGTTIVGLAAGNAFPTDPNGGNASMMLGWTTAAPTGVGSDILPTMAKANYGGIGNSGFSIPLGAGTYSLWIQDYDDPATYQLSLVLEATVAPVIKVTSKKVSSKQAIVSGSASGAFTTVTYRLGTKGAFKRAKGTGAAWKIVASKLKKGPNIVTVRAIGSYGTSSKKLTIIKS